MRGKSQSQFVSSLMKMRRRGLIDSCLSQSQCCILSQVYFQCGGAGDPQTDGVAQPASSASPSCSRSISSCIDVPRRSATPPPTPPPPVCCLLITSNEPHTHTALCSCPAQQEVDMDELMAAMVLSSLSCSPPPQSSAHRATAAPWTDSGTVELSDSSSSSYWSVDRGPRSPGPPSPAAEANGRSATPPDEGLDMELDQVLFEEPAPRKRRNSLKVAYRCLWPSCEKVLTSLVGIKRHIRTTHLCHGGEHERCSRSEEDFYYSEINQWDGPLQQSPPSAPQCGPTSSPPSPPSSPSPPSCSTLSRSAPSPCSSIWQVQSEHSYQAPPPSHVVSPGASASCRVTAPSTTCSRQGAAVRVRSVSVGEQWLQHQSAPCRSVLLYAPGPSGALQLSHCCVRLSGGFEARPRSVGKFTASSIGSCGARRAAGRRPASASWTDPGDGLLLLPGFCSSYCLVFTFFGLQGVSQTVLSRRLN
uniref:Zinc finger protein 395-like n=1 Tax=Fundulus heteroclitus TaxID=8078 RepID=A0A3Q2PCE6_FUNHE